MTVWVVLSARRVSERLTQLVDQGEVSSATRLSSSINAFLDKLKAFCQQHGGSMILATYERMILNLSTNAAEEIPNIVTQYSEELHGKLDVGIGMNMQEAAAASRLSSYSGQIELYDPRKDYPETYLVKQEFHAGAISLPPNIFDPEIPDSDDKSKMQPVKDKFRPEKTYMPKTVKPEAVVSPDAQTAAQANSQLIQAMMQEVGFIPPRPQQQPQGQPRDLLEALNGGPIPGRAPVRPETEERHQEAEQAVKQRVAEAEAMAEEVNQRLARLLAQVKEQIPTIMQLHDSNPQAFKQAMNVVSKLVTLASRRTKMSKSEADDTAEQLDKAIRRRQGYRSPGGRVIHNYPIGTRIKRRRKVLVNGKAVWRSVGAGQVKDSAGSPISVISSNAGAINEG